jgi:dsRNA-specific ribonuclease
MSNAMEKSWKNRLQEYCQKANLRLPNYRIRQQTGAPNKMRFQVSPVYF